MLAGLLFANADGEPGEGVATARFAGATVIEYQARSLTTVGVSHIVVLGERSSPPLRGAIARIRRGGMTVDLVSDAKAAFASFHPRSPIVMVAEGLVDAEAAIAAVASSPVEALLVVPGVDAPPAFERIGAGRAWAGVARITPQRLGELAGLPPDYQPCSTLLRLVEAAGAAAIAVPAPTATPVVAQGPADLAAADDRRLALALRSRADVFDTYVLNPVVRPLARLAHHRQIGAAAVAAIAGAALLVGLSLLATGSSAGAGLAILVALTGAATARLLARIAERDTFGGRLDRTIAVGGVVAALLLGLRCDAAGRGRAGLAIALALVVAAVLAERTRSAPGRWWSVEGAIAAVAVAALVGAPVAGLSLAAVYAAAMLAIAIERLRGLAPL